MRPRGAFRRMRSCGSGSPTTPSGRGSTWHESSRSKNKYKSSDVKVLQRSSRSCSRARWPFAPRSPSKRIAWKRTATGCLLQHAALHAGWMKTARRRPPGNASTHGGRPCACPKYLDEGLAKSWRMGLRGVSSLPAIGVRGAFCFAATAAATSLPLIEILRRCEVRGRHGGARPSAPPPTAALSTSHCREIAPPRTAAMR
mmetsp:Transcript_159554/g.511985  ORF Transcript_159554/g.511985 Transcript_159554/m.511985 type:complete len:200 (-) Transcript_159554:1319-1918(-)